MRGNQTIMLIGNLGKDPVLRQTSSGTPVANFSVGVNDRYVDKKGQLQTKTEWFNVVAWGKVAEHCTEYLAKGRQVHVTGRMQSRVYKDKDGVERRVMELHTNDVTFLGPKGTAKDSAPEAEFPYPIESSLEAGDEEVPF